MSAVLLSKAKQLEESLKIKDREYESKTYKNCFVGNECVDLMIKLNFAKNEQHAVQFGNILIENDIIESVENQNEFKNEEIFYRFVEGYTEMNDSVARISMAMRMPSTLSDTLRSTSRFSQLHLSKRSTILSVKDLLAPNSRYVSRKAVYYRVNKYMRQNRLGDANKFLLEILGYVSKDSFIDWSISKEASADENHSNHTSSATKEKNLQKLMGESTACWMDCKMLECELKLFYEHNEGDYSVYKDCISKLQSIVGTLERALHKDPSLRTESYYFRFMECECRALIAYSIVKSNKLGFACYAGLALEQCRKAMQLDAFHSLSHAVYGYLLDRCLDNHEDARRYLEYALTLNNYYDVASNDDDNEEDTDNNKDHSWHRFALIHIWLATLLVNFEDEIREIEYKVEVELRQSAMIPKVSQSFEEEEVPSTSLEEQSSSFLVKQISIAHRYNRHKLRMLRHASVESADGYACDGDFSPSVSMSVNANVSQWPPPLPQYELKTEESMDFTKMISERLAEENQLTANMSEQFGNDFMSQMTTLSAKPDDHFLSALELEPQNSKFHCLYGVFLIQKERFEDAKVHFEKAIKYDPNNVVALNNLGYILSLSVKSRYLSNILVSVCSMHRVSASIKKQKLI